MAELLFKKGFDLKMAALEKAAARVNFNKLRLLLGTWELDITDDDIEYLLGLPSATISVPDRGMCVQLNKFCRTIPNVKFVIDVGDFAFVFRDLGKRYPFWEIV